MKSNQMRRVRLRKSRTKTELESVFLNNCLQLKNTVWWGFKVPLCVRLTEKYSRQITPVSQTEQQEMCICCCFFYFKALNKFLFITRGFPDVCMCTCCNSDRFFSPFKCLLWRLLMCVNSFGCFLCSCALFGQWETLRHCQFWQRLLLHFHGHTVSSVARLLLCMTGLLYIFFNHCKQSLKKKKINFTFAAFIVINRCLTGLSKVPTHCQEVVLQLPPPRISI